MESGRENQKETFTLAKCEEYIPGIVDSEKNTQLWDAALQWMDKSNQRQGLAVIFRYPDANIGKPFKDQMTEEVDGTSCIVRFE